MEYNFDEESVHNITEWARNAKVPQTIQLSKYENIQDVPKFVIANIYDIEQHYPESLYNSAITRLYRLKEFLEKQEEKKKGEE